jgi:TolB protein
LTSRIKGSVLIAAAFAMSACYPDQAELTTPSEQPGVEAPALEAGHGIVFVSHRDEGNSELYAMNEDGSGQTNLSQNEISVERNPSVSGDGTRIAYTRRANMGAFEDIFIMDADGSNVRNLTNTSLPEDDPAFSPDGMKVAFSRQSNIIVINADGSSETPLTLETTGQNIMADWSPDGSRIAFVSTRGGAFSVYSMGADGSDVQRLTTPPSGADDYSPAWSPDGQRILFGRVGPGAYGLYLIAADGTGEIRVTESPTSDGSPDWSPNGARIVFARDNLSNETDIYTINTDGSDPRQLTSAPNHDIQPSWGVIVTDPGSTPTGSDVVVTPVDPETNASPATLTFASVTLAGTTTLTTSNQGAAPPQGFQLGEPPIYYELQTTTTYTGAITVCIDYSGTSLAGDDNLHLLHGNAGGTWTEVTSSSDPGGNIICGIVTSLSPFIVTKFEFAFQGFFAPVDNPGPNASVVNTTTAGRGIAVKFSLGGSHGLDIFLEGHPKFVTSACDNSDTQAPVEATTASPGGLSYDPAANQYTYVWKTAKAWAGRCGIFQLGLQDGSNHQALFRFTK